MKRLLLLLLLVGPAFSAYGVIDSLVYDSGAGNYPDVLYISGNVYAVAHTGAGSDGWVSTLSIDSSGNIGDSVIDSLEYDTANSYTTSFVHVSGEIYAVAYRGTDGDGFVKTFTIDSSGNIGDSVIDSLEFDTANGYEPNMIHISGDYYTVAYRGVDDDGFISTITIDASGNIADAVTDTLEYDTANGYEPNMIHISGDYYAVAYRGTDSDGFISTITIDASGNIGDAVIDSLEYDTANGEAPHIIQISGDYYAVAHSGAGSDGWVSTLSIDSSGNIGDAVIDTLEFDTSNGDKPIIAHITGTTYFVSYTGPDSDGWIAVFTISTNGEISDSASDHFEFDESNGLEPFIIPLSEYKFFVAYRGDGSLGYVKSVDLPPPACSDNVCNGVETYSTCPGDCCESDCTSTADTAYHSECNTYNSCSGFVSGCNNQVLSYTYCSDADTYIACPSSTTNCESDEYCLSGTGCSACSTVCDHSCQSSACYGTDPDCDDSGGATLACCGNTYCDGSDNCLNCQSDCGICPLNCGNGICDEDENMCTCPDDCGVCTGPFGPCQSYSCISGACSVSYDFNCCGNSVCEAGETFENCRNDCEPNQISVELLTPLEGFIGQRGEIIPVRVKLLFDDEFNGVGASVSVSGFFGTITLDEETSGFYSKNITIPYDTESGNYSVNVRAEKGVITLANFSIKVGEDLKISLATNIEEITLTQILNITGSIKNSFDTLVECSVNITIKDLSGNIIYSEVRNNIVTYYTSYQTSTIDPSGQWIIEVSAVDSFGNTGSVNKTITALLPEPGTYYDITILSPLVSEFSRKDIITISARVEYFGDSVGLASVSFKDPFGASIAMSEGSVVGVYTAEYTLPPDASLGVWNMQVQASKEYEGFSRKYVEILPANLNVQILGVERSTYQVGETINLKFLVTYADGSSVELPSIDLIVNNETVKLQRGSEGAYLTNYVVSGEGTLSFSVTAGDSNQNIGANQLVLNVSGTSVFYYFNEYPYIVYPIITLFLVSAGFGVYKVSMKRFAGSLKDNKGVITKKIKDLQRDYYESGSISKEIFEKKYAELDRELEEMNNKIKKQQGK